MSALTIILILIGVGYSAVSFTRFLVWLDTISCVAGHTQRTQKIDVKQDS